MSTEEDLPHGLIRGGFSIGRAARAKDRDLEQVAAADEHGVDGEALWASMRRFAAGVTVMTAVGEEGYLGITVSAFSLASLEPALVLASINEHSQVLEAIRVSGAFAATVLSSRQELIAEMFAGRAPRPATDFSDLPHKSDRSHVVL